jgi:hypothetical protein
MKPSGEPRDVDVTVTMDTPDGVFAFMGYEVKHWKSKLDVSAKSTFQTSRL